MSKSDTSSGRSIKALVARFNGAYGIVLLMTIVTFVTLSATPSDDGWRAVGLSVAVCTAFLGIVGSDVSRRSAHMAAITGLTGIALAAVAATIDSDSLLIFAAAIAAALLFVSEGAILRQVVRSTNVDFRTILGAITSYTMLGLLFSFIYLSVAIAQDAALFIDHATIGRGELIFFSYTTLTTTGYGNLVPASQPGQSIAVIEMLMGQIFLVTLVARLVSLWQPRGGKNRDAAAG